MKREREREAEKQKEIERGSGDTTKQNGVNRWNEILNPKILNQTKLWALRTWVALMKWANY